MQEKISAILLNFRHLDDTVKCLKTLMDSDLGSIVDYWVVDNSPKPSTKKFLISNFPKLNYISSPANLGFAGGNNQAILAGLSNGVDYFLIINPDVTIGKSFFKPLVQHFKDRKVGIVAPVIYHSQKNKKVFGLEGAVEWNYAKPTHRNLTILNDLNSVTSEFVTFACVLIRKEVFLKAGLLDQRYFMYFEDVDYCLSAGKAGFKIILDPKIQVSHRTSSSFDRPTQKLGISFRSHLLFINKWLPLRKRLIPYFYVLTTYPYLYLLWTYHGLKYKNG